MLKGASHVDATDPVATQNLRQFREIESNGTSDIMKLKIAMELSRVRFI
jgi:hypothetical protein